MSQVKLGLKDLNPDQKVQLGLEVVAALTGNGQFPTPTPPLNVITALTTGLQDAITAQKAAQQAALMATLAVRAAEGQFDAGLTTLGSYIQVASGGNETLILSAGVGVRSTGAAVGTLPAPGGLSATNGDMPQEIDLHWNPVPHASTYMVQYTADPLTASSVWTPLPPVTKSKTTAPGLTAGTRYWFHVATVGTAGQGPWSDPATRMAV